MAASTFSIFFAVLGSICGAFWLCSRQCVAGALEGNEQQLIFWGEWFGLLFVTTLAILTFELWIPLAVVRLWGTNIVAKCWPFWRWMTIICFIPRFGATFFEIFFSRLAGVQNGDDDEDHFEEEIRTIVSEGHREGLLEEDARGMIEGVIELGDVSVSEIMTPRTDMVSIPLTMEWDEMLRFVITIPHSRVPVYDKSRDDIVGILFVKDLMKELVKPNPAYRSNWQSLLKEPHFVPETKPVGVLMQEFQRVGKRAPDSDESGEVVEDSSPRMHIALVLDEYGGVSGLVTLEDILEEIVGEIVDEHDPVVEEADIREISPGVFEVLGKVHIDELNEKLELELPEDEDFDTIAGYIFSSLGHVPKTGESLEFANRRITVIKVTTRRIEKVRIEPLTAPDS